MADVAVGVVVPGEVTMYVRVLYMSTSFVIL